MGSVEDTLAGGVEAYLEAQLRKELLRFITCGSVDDGKSTLIGRLLYESKLIFDDQLAALEGDSKRVGTQGGDLDFALLVDGLQAEREQGITIDVAYRFFATDRRKFIVADTPGHEQYTRNMVTGASTADLAIILIDARKGVLDQTRRHSYLANLVGIRSVVVAINKIDLVDYDEATCRRIEHDYRNFAQALDFDHIEVIPLSALKGDNLLGDRPSPNTTWYSGPSLLQHLETVPLAKTSGGPFRLPVQWVSRPDLDFRGFAGTIVGGQVTVGDPVRVLPSGQTSTVERIVTADGDLDRAEGEQAVTLTLTDEIDISRGDLICAADAPAGVADQFEAHVVWMDDEPMLPGRRYLLKVGPATTGVALSAPKYVVNVNTLEHTAARTLQLNDIGVLNLSLDRPIPFDPYSANRDTGGFILIDRRTNNTIAAGTLHFALRRADNVHWQHLDIDKTARSSLNGHRPAVLWFTGLSGAGKSTIANLVEKRLHSLGVHTMTLDGDNIRHGLNRDLGFTDADRVENIRRVGEVAHLLVDAGLVVLVSFISPFRAERQLARDLLDDGEFIEIHVATPVETAEARDPKGLYAKARRGELPNFTGIDSPYEEPHNPELRIDTTQTSAIDAAQHIITYLGQRGIIPDQG